MKTPLSLLAIAIVHFACQLPAVAQEPTKADSKPDAPAPTLASLSWLTGRWRGETPDVLIEEHWSAAAGDSMMGMFRVVVGGKIRLYEIISLEQEAAGPVMRLKHFSRGLIGKEEIDKPLVVPLVSVDGQTAVFKKHDPQDSLTLTYRLTGDELVVTLEKQRNGKPLRDEYKFKRQ